jgi:F-box-like
MRVMRVMRPLHSLRRACAPISLLPFEVLALIFHFLSLEEPPLSGRKKLGWIRATHVCRLWRQVALGDSSLWARISGTPNRTVLISEMLVRARNVPLDIDIDLNGTLRPENLLLMFLPHISRTRKIRVHTSWDLHPDSVRGLYSLEAPVLEHFELGIPLTSSLTFRELGGTTLFKGRAPGLRTFSLSSIFIPWSLIPRGQLTQLEISLDNETISDVPLHGDLNQLISLLDNCPKLEILALGRCLPSQLSQFEHCHIIHLPRLSRLSLVGPSSRVTNLLKMLKLPSSTTLHLHCTSENTTTCNNHCLLPVVSAHVQSSALVEFKSLMVTVGSIIGYMGYSLKVTASTSLPTSKISRLQDFENHMDDDDEFFLLFDDLFKCARPSGHYTNLIERVCKMLPISNLEFLSISAPSSLGDRINLVELFKHCTKVSAMQAVGNGTYGLVRALTGSTSKVTNTNTPGRNSITPSAHAHAPIFPKLTFLSLKRLHFAHIEPIGILFDIVKKGLQKRKVAYKAPLKVLCIDKCAITTKHANALQKLVQEFHWDKKEHILY